MSYRLFWGDLHSHCSVSYGHGTTKQALARARQQLDFCSVTGHAFWPDMPTDRAVYGEIIDYHREGFARLARNWDKLLAAHAAATEEGSFVAIPSYEWHSRAFGDHNVYAMSPALELRDAPDLPALRALAVQNNSLIIPHHIGYAAGFRGIDWRHFRADASPFVEIFSLHGCSESESAPYPMLHDMGPRDAGSTAEAGWALGHKFGVIGSTDHHAAWPGSHGDGRMGVFARTLTRESLGEAFRARRVFAATGDRIDARLFVEDAWIGETVRAPGTRRLRVAVEGVDTISRVEVLKNGRILRRFHPEAPAPAAGPSLYRLRIAWGWGPRERTVRWNARMELSEGSIRAVETCFSGPPVVAPVRGQGDAEVADAEDLPHAVEERSEKAVAWRSVTTGNLSMRHGTTQGLSVELEAPEGATLTLVANGQRFVHSLGELQAGGRAHYLRGWLSEALRVGPLTPNGLCSIHAEFEDGPENGTDHYRLRVEQTNGQWAWLTPIWVEQ